MRENLLIVFLLIICIILIFKKQSDYTPSQGAPSLQILNIGMDIDTTAWSVSELVPSSGGTGNRMLQKVWDTPGAYGFRKQLQVGGGGSTWFLMKDPSTLMTVSLNPIATFTVSGTSYSIPGFVCVSKGTIDPNLDCGSTATNVSGSCACNQGYYGNGNTCTQCPANQTSVLGAQTSSSCSTLTLCPVDCNAAYNDAMTAVRSHAGYPVTLGSPNITQNLNRCFYRHNIVCTSTLCVNSGVTFPTTSEIEYSDYSCDKTSQFYYNSPVSTAPVTSTKSQLMCGTIPNSYWTSGDCTVCGVNDRQINGSCVSLPAGKYWTTTSGTSSSAFATCSAGYTTTAGTTGTYNTAGTNATCVSNQFIIRGTSGGNPPATSQAPTLASSMGSVVYSPTTGVYTWSPATTKTYNVTMAGSHCSGMKGVLLAGTYTFNQGTNYYFVIGHDAGNSGGGGTFIFNGFPLTKTNCILAAGGAGTVGSGVTSPAGTGSNGDGTNVYSIVGSNYIPCGAGLNWMTTSAGFSGGAYNSGWGAITSTLSSFGGGGMYGGGGYTGGSGTNGTNGMGGTSYYPAGFTANANNMYSQGYIQIS